MTLIKKQGEYEGRNSLPPIAYVVVFKAVCDLVPTLWFNLIIHCFSCPNPAPYKYT